MRAYQMAHPHAKGRVKIDIAEVSKGKGPGVPSTILALGVLERQRQHPATTPQIINVQVSETSANKRQAPGTLLSTLHPTGDLRASKAA